MAKQLFAALEDRTMYKHEVKTCPRCTGLFECKSGDVTHCQCRQVNISDDTLKFMELSDYEDCLCGKCLVEINTMMNFKKSHPFPKEKRWMIEGLHYYYDNGNFVFTELYHMQRGYCCKNSCRHCAYGNRKK